MTCSDDQKVFFLGLSLPHTVCDSGQGGHPELPQPDAQQGKEDLTFCSWSFMNFSLRLGCCQVATLIIYALVCPQ